ncbi:hypothetical protein ACFFX0_08495 [Citricoccus parietis]|uniref:Uncharacterized protein n=1 Tax=Citricoccus parietis TaxID=592307 RepID=A0ABV5FX19_9MICC
MGTETALRTPSGPICTRRPPAVSVTQTESLEAVAQKAGRDASPSGILLMAPSTVRRRTACPDIRVIQTAPSPVTATS